MRGLIIVGFLALLTPAVVAAPATREDIRQLRGEVKEDISKLRGEIKDDIKQVIHYVDKRFDDASKRFDMLMWFIGILSVVSTGVISYMISRIGKQDAKINTVESRFEHYDLKALIHDLRTADAETKKALKAALK